ncbi:HEAT repeat domain-containing protein [Motilibacter aurantiacus]|uniref:HEAT repeat domain-containing protein n=1 Tax=Motilibacter aurantiacus TaxID=2714955 RepID=UPI00140778AB|nr:HEAT repeat domain-containing protein [Motilibacter aurantiacus]NHC46763.1 HEAT repeat domain-containing protein [Motilibacter aurantiacus]
MGLVRRTAQAPAAEEQRAARRDSAGLQQQLRAGDAEQRRRAALDLEGDAAAVPALLAALQEERDVPAREALLTTLAGHDVAEVGLALSGELRSEDATRRNAAVNALQAMPLAVESLVGQGILQDEDADVRVLAVMVLSAVAHPGVPEWLRPVVAADPEPNVVAAAVDVAVTIGSGIAHELSTVATGRFPQNPYLHFLARQAART